ncbi:hypothetical protein OAA39_00880 [bacterium]|nr:hypothetical protein [bacterium]
MMVKKFKHPVVQFAHEHPILFSLFGTTVFFYFPARLIGKTIRTAKYGEPGLGNIPTLMSSSQRSQFTGSGNVDIHQFGALGNVPPAGSSLTGDQLFKIAYDETCQRAKAGEIAPDLINNYAAARYNELSASGQYNIVVPYAPPSNQGYDASGFYKDTRHLQTITPAKGSGVTNPIASQRDHRNGGSIAPPVAGKTYVSPVSSAESFHANPSVVNLLGQDSVFAGLGMLHKLR